MTSPSTTPPKILGSSQLYTAAMILGVMLFPHVMLAIHLQWPVQVFTLHAVIVVITFGLAVRAENVERAAAAAQRKKTVKKQPSKTDTLIWLDRSLGDTGER